MKQVKHTDRYGKSKHVENYRVVTDQLYPRRDGCTHNARYFEHYDDALHAYLHSVMNQVFDERLMERVSFDIRCDEDGTYSPMFESFQLHTLGSYGLKGE